MGKIRKKERNLHRFFVPSSIKESRETESTPALTVMVSRRSVFVTLTSFFFFFIQVNSDHFGFRDIGFGRASTVVIIDLNGTLKKENERWTHSMSLV